jgi:hypothetical protein
MSEIRTAAEAQQAIERVAGLIEKLNGLIDQETELVRAGHVRKATALTAAKSGLAAELYAAGERLKANRDFLLRTVPAAAHALHRLQDGFRAALQRNMIVIATAHAVSEGIVRRLSGDMARNASPQLYGASGRTVPPSTKRGQPLAVSRVL